MQDGFLAMKLNWWRSAIRLDDSGDWVHSEHLSAPVSSREESE